MMSSRCSCRFAVACVGSGSVVKMAVSSANLYICIRLLHGYPQHETQLYDSYNKMLARKLSANMYDIYHCCVYSEKLLMIDRGTVRNM